jgi:hypothetical protein
MRILDINDSLAALIDVNISCGCNCFWDGYIFGWYNGRVDRRARARVFMPIGGSPLRPDYILIKKRYNDANSNSPKPHLFIRATPIHYQLIIRLFLLSHILIGFKISVFVHKQQLPMDFFG